MASPISSVVPSLDGVVLAVLARTSAPLTLSAVHRLAGKGSLSGVRRTLVRLVRTGVVLAVPGGYVLNRDHVAAPAIDRLADLWSEVFDRVRRAVELWPEPPTMVGCFGSAARRDGDETSDIDLLVVSDAEDADARAAELARQVESWTGNATRVAAVGADDVHRMQRAREPILAEWERDLVVICGRRDALETQG